jgi:hypothetical protein
MGYKRKVSYSHYLPIQSYSIFNPINASGFSVPWVLFVRVLMFVQHHEPLNFENDHSTLSKLAWNAKFLKATLCGIDANNANSVEPL